jgi:5-methylcytosine-specific restriction protein A
MISRFLHAAKETVLKGKPFKMRSPEWHTVRNDYIKDHNYCRCCGSRDNLEVHHIKPFHLHPELELDPTNLITLCEGDNKCHFNIGHLRNWKTFNEKVIEDAKELLDKKTMKPTRARFLGTNIRV